LVEALSSGLEEKHLLVYVVDPAVSEILGENHWDGAIGHSDGDFLMVVDTNMGFNKVNPNVENALDYQVRIEDDENVTSRLAVTYRNQSAGSRDPCVQEADYPPTYREMMEGCYWNYLRIYVPESSELVQSPELTLPEGSLRARGSGDGGMLLGAQESTVESGKDVHGLFFVVAPAERREMVFEYRLPSSVLESDDSTKTYTLLVQKQPGTQAVPLRVEVQLPAGSTLVSSSPEARTSSDGGVVFQTDLREDREFEVTFRR
jgi:hypothetical protein